MRFVENGPSIPDDLLTARDEGRVVFFCGAGVSRAYAALPDFFGLAERVIKTLGALASDPVCKLLKEAREIDKRIGVRGLISADRIFGLLERDFPLSDIESAVAQALRPASDVNLSAHRALLDIATTPQGKIRLVTTNFDRLFNDCDPKIQLLQSPYLPRLSREEDFDGVIYLHGVANEDYSGAEGGGFTLTSSGFGRAYLAEGWATEFFREVLDKYVVVFVGYSADDPPIQYLLEGLSKKVGSEKKIYAFQEGTENDATTRWRHKGIDAIAYGADNDHQMLWQTLELWAERAKDSDAWTQRVIDAAANRPEKLRPHERGQIAHIVSTNDGAQKFAASKLIAPAEWLCVFDPSIRYATPRTIGYGDEGYWVDPFELFGLDSDATPPKVFPGDSNSTREMPPNAWSAFSMSRLDHFDAQERLQSGASPFLSTGVAGLPPRLNHMATWFANAADQPAAAWWAVKSRGLHLEVQNKVKWRLRTDEKDIFPVVRRVWRYIFEEWNSPPQNFHFEIHELKSSVAKEEWDRAFAEQYSTICRPHLKVAAEHWNGLTPPLSSTDLKIKDFLSLDVVYADSHNHDMVPNEWVGYVVSALRKNLERAWDMESELGGYGLNITTCMNHIDGEPLRDSYGNSHGLSGYLVSFYRLFERLVAIDPLAARQELDRWPEDETIFCRLRIWAAGKSQVVSASHFSKMLINLNDRAFWNPYHSRDLLIVLAQHWSSIPDSARKRIEKKLLKGPPKWVNEKAAKYKERRAWSTLSRIAWMAKMGCSFILILPSVSQKLKAMLPEWKEKYADGAVESMEGNGGAVRTETSYTALLGLPLADILTTANSLNGRGEDFLVEINPFAGLAKDRPKRAFSALINAAKRDEYPAWAWRTFFHSESRENDKPRFCALIAERVSRLPNSVCADLLRPISDWIAKVGQRLAAEFPSSFELLLSKLIDVLELKPETGESGVGRENNGVDWAMESINSAVGKIAQAMLQMPSISGLSQNEGLPKSWIRSANALLCLQGDLRKYALVIFSHRLVWLYYVDNDWALSHLVIPLELDDGNDSAAIWSGFLWAGKRPDKHLFLRMKPSLLSLAKNRGISRRGYTESLTGMLLAGWGMNRGDRESLINDEELREVLLRTDDKFRSRLLWQIKTWARSDAGIEHGWPGLVLDLLKYVWPRQKAVRTAKVSASLVELAFSNIDQFTAVADLILPLLTTIDTQHISLPYSEDEKLVVDRYPRQSLDLIFAILPEQIVRWPYGIDSVLNRIIEADVSLKNDAKYVELNRQWNSR